jgi:hypothetical protein
MKGIQYIMTLKSKSKKQTQKASAKVVNVRVSAAPKPAKKKKNSGGSRRKPNLSSLARYGWAASLIDPFTVSGFRIPDEKVYSTCTAQLRDRITVTAKLDTASTAYGAGFIFRPSGQNSYSPALTYVQSTGIYTFPAAGAYTNFFSVGVVNSLASSYRVTSAGLSVFSTANFTDNQGRICCSFVPGNNTTVAYGSTTASIKMSDTLQQPNLSDTPINRQKYCSITWVPSDRTNYEFRPLGSNPDSSPGSYQNNNIGSLYFLADGLNQPVTFEVEVVLNIEYIPQSAAISVVNPQPSVFDTQAMEYALNHPVVSNMFHHISEDSATTNFSGNLSTSTATSTIADYGAGIWDTVSRGAYAIGDTLGKFSKGYSKGIGSSNDVGYVMAQLQGLTYH